MTTKELNVVMDTFEAATKNGQQGFAEAARLYVVAIDGHEQGRQLFAKRFMFSARQWNKFEQIGRGKMDVRLLAMMAGHNTHRVSMLPLELQKQVLDGKAFSVVMAGGKVARLPILTIATDLANQVFYRERIRTVEEQIEWLKARTQKARSQSAVTPAAFEHIRYHGNIIVFDRPQCSMTFAELFNTWPEGERRKIIDAEIKRRMLA